MATAGKNLSYYKPETVPSGESMRVGIVVSEWNDSITGNLLKGATEALLENGVSEENIIIKWVPGSFELALGAKFLLNHSQVDGVVALGSVIQGETKHFDFVCNATAHGIMEVGLDTDKPVIFGVLTDNTMQQAIDRSGGKHGNKGIECAIACMKMIDLKSKL